MCNQQTFVNIQDRQWRYFALLVTFTAPRGLTPLWNDYYRHPQHTAIPFRRSTAAGSAIFISLSGFEGLPRPDLLPTVGNKS